MTDRTIISYLRVSTSRQGRSGLGIEAQRSTLRHFAKAEGFEVVRELVAGAIAAMLAAMVMKQPALVAVAPVGAT